LQRKTPAEITILTVVNCQTGKSTKFI
jgi:hypothetical protein